MDTAELKGLLDKATKGPWTPYLDAKCVQIDFDGKNGVRPCVVGWGGFDSNDLPMRENRANAALICALRNNADELIASAERVARLEAALRTIQHSMKEALIAGNDKFREIRLSADIARQALGEPR